MSNTNETLADILREMRTYFQRQKRNGNPEHRPWRQVLSDWADRIEAAAVRERVEREFAHKKVEEALSDEIAIRDEKIRQSAPGNAAAMREALEAFQGWYEEVRSYVYHSVKLATAVDKMRAALSAPARNCDRYGDEE